MFFGFLHIHLIVICMKMEKYPVVITEMTKRKHVNVMEHEGDQGHIPVVHHNSAEL